MKKTWRETRPVYVSGSGLHRYQRLSETPYVTLGLTAVREALADAGIQWCSVDSAYTGTALIGMAASLPMLASSGRLGNPDGAGGKCLGFGLDRGAPSLSDVASGISDVSITIGVDKPGPVGSGPGKSNIRDLVGAFAVPFTHFALLTNQYMNRYNVKIEEVVAVAVKNNRNGANNPYAQRQKPVTLDEVLAGPPISGSLTRLQCCRVGAGAAAVMVASAEAIADLGINRSRAIRVITSVTQAEQVYRGAKNFETELTRATVAQAYQEAGIGPKDLEVVEVHDAFTIEELTVRGNAGAVRGGRRRGDELPAAPPISAVNARSARRVDCSRWDIRSGRPERVRLRSSRGSCAARRESAATPREDWPRAYGGRRRGLRGARAGERSLSLLSKSAA